MAFMRDFFLLFFSLVPFSGSGTARYELHFMCVCVCACGSDVDYRIKKVTNRPFIPGGSGIHLRRELLGIGDPSTERGYQCT
ncbi:hypothetical protein F5Y00DRAFT_227687 [Daldinia vernicosa]|uniref:uncharacterized protein n=1 Tax=Daldinia vernicosa TaxID=114800 RepID=UPI002008AAD4|nr:uncharacterized protein F5Y00DRAFT_227687 [Daldinia vernicosa]KAI0852254.1 hypothetical protein F5Y00DRAFT_227687 [Daldinia vernicosa]